MTDAEKEVFVIPEAVGDPSRSLRFRIACDQEQSTTTDRKVRLTDA